MSYQKDRDEFIGTIVTELEYWGAGYGHKGVALARLILRHAATIQCCEEEAILRARQRIDAACKPWSIVPKFSAEPRGACVKLLLPSGRYNGASEEEGFCVPTR